MNTYFAFDLDGTVTTQELLPIIASAVDLQNEMRLLTSLTLSGAIPFEDSFRLRCAILQSIPISEVQSIVADVPLNENIARFIRDNAERCAIVTGNLDVWIRPLIEQLGCQVFSSRAATEGDRLIRLDSVMHKSVPIRHLKTQVDRVVAIGESVNDVPMFEVADIGIAFGGVHDPSPSLIEISDYLTYDGAALCRLLNTL